MINVAIDAMGGDHAPEEIVKGAVLAVQKNKEVTISLVGNKDRLSALISGMPETESARIMIIPASEVIETSDHPVEAVRKKKDSSMIVGMKMVHDGVSQAFISGGNSGALMVGAQVVVGREKGISRAPFAHVLPHSKGFSLMLDCGANVDVRPEHLVSFAHLGSDYVKRMNGIDNPRVGLINIGAEETKGNELTIEAYKLLEQEAGINFVGNIEPTGITEGGADVLVCDGFTGNMIIKLYEGLGKLLMNVVKDSLSTNTKTKVGALLIKKELKESFKPFDAHRYGGAPVLGLKGLVLKVHGNAKAIEYCNAVLQCVEYERMGQ